MTYKFIKHNTACLTGRFQHLVWEFPDVTHCLEKDDDGCESPLYFAGVSRDLERGAFVVAHVGHRHHPAGV